MLEKYSVLFCWVPSHVGIRGNELADAAAKAALNETLTIMTLPYSDFNPLVKRFISGKWSDFWANHFNIVKRRLPGQCIHLHSRAMRYPLALDVVNNVAMRTYIVSVDFVIVSTGN